MNADGTIATAIWNDFSQRATHEMALKTKALTKAYYGKDARFTYLNGFSTGGRQGHKEAQVYPEDFDGILAGAPVVNLTRLHGYLTYPPIVIQRDLGGVAPTQAQLDLVSNAAINACDLVNGQHLGYIPDPLQCRYDAVTDANVRCVSAGGTNNTSSCVSLAQATAINKMWYGQTPDGSVPSPATDIGTGPALSTNQQWYGLPRGTSLAAVARTEPFFFLDQLALSLQDPRFASPTFINATGNGANLWKNLTYAELSRSADRGIQLQNAFGNVNADNPDLTTFQARGGKLLTYHGTADILVPAQGTINYYNRVLAQMGGITPVQSFYRLYLVPGMSHSLTNGTSNPNANPPLPNINQLYTALTDWVEKGVAPDRMNIVTAVTTANPVQKSRPLCIYPQKAVHVSGDPNVAASYACS